MRPTGPHCPCPHLFFLHDTATTEIYTLSLHDALPIFASTSAEPTTTPSAPAAMALACAPVLMPNPTATRSEEHTSELQSLRHLVCRLLLEKKKPTDRARSHRSASS